MKSFIYLSALSTLLFVSGCGAPGMQNRTAPLTQVRPVEALPTEVAADTITVAQFRYVCDAMARDLIRQPFVVRAARPPIVTVRKIQNKTGIYIDEQIFQETIRAKLMENAGGLVLFRDDVSYRDIVEERVRQSNEELTVTLTDTVLEKRTHDRVKDREYEHGTLSGASDTSEQAGNLQEETNMEMSQTATVKSGIAPADYFLRGIVYQVNERDMTKQNRGMSYFQYQFRVVDARNGLIVWEKMLSSKLAGEYMLAPKVNAADPNNPGATQGQAPAGWPTGPVNQPGAVPNPPGVTSGQTNPQGTQQPVPQGNYQPAQQQNPPVMQQIIEQTFPIIKQMQNK